MFVILFYFVLTLIKPALTNVHYYLTMLLNAVVCFFVVFFVAKGMIVKYIIDNDLISIDPLAESTAASGTLDMWLLAANSAMLDWLW